MTRGDGTMVGNLAAGFVPLLLARCELRRRDNDSRTRARCPRAGNALAYDGHAAVGRERYKTPNAIVREAVTISQWGGVIQKKNRPSGTVSGQRPRVGVL